MYYNKNAQAQIKLTRDAFEAIPNKQHVLKWCWDQYRRDVKITQRKIEKEQPDQKGQDRLWNEVNQRFREDMRMWFWSHYRAYIARMKKDNPETYKTEWIHASDL
jgi:DNA-binding FadR family transcriptional regulator